jgi:hypothetical protein
VAAGTDEEYRWTRAWWNAARAVERDRWTGRGSLSKRMVLRALGAMAQRRGTRVLDVGCRGLALACGLDDSTVALVLRALREEPDPLVELLAAGTGERADTYTLRIPDAGLHAAAWRPWRAGRIEVHPVFRELGATCALVYEALTEAAPVQRRVVAHDAALPAGTVDEALRTLAEHGLAQRVPNEGWRRGPVHPDRLARTLGVDELVERLVRRYRAERAAWRDLLERRGAIRTPVVVSGPDEPDTWPDVLHPPEPRTPAEHAYDARLAALDAPPPANAGSFDAALELLRTQLGATVLAGG